VRGAGFAMIRTTRITTFAEHGRDGAARVWRVAATQPGWVSRIAALTFLIVIGLPIVLLILLALLAAVVVFTVLALVSMVVMWVRGLFPQHDGRENVRVMRRVDGP
jgi:uncharacterized BrkB/YihY/UPF0761 family membrane protein